MKRRLRFALTAAVIALVAGTVSQTGFAQYASEMDIGPGTILVASQKLEDPNFAETVVVILEREDDGTLGIIINRPSPVSLTRLFPNIKRAPSDPVYAGGPVGLTLGQALVRSRDAIARATHLEGDVYVIAEKSAIEKLVSAQTASSKFRLYLGYAGWGAGQLENEIRLGAWRIMNRGPGTLFDSAPNTLWLRLNRESETRMAGLQMPVLFSLPTP